MLLEDELQQLRARLSHKELALERIGRRVAQQRDALAVDPTQCVHADVSSTASEACQHGGLDEAHAFGRGAHTRLCAQSAGLL